MIRVKTFAFHEYIFRLYNEDALGNSTREKSIEKYEKILSDRAKALEPMEDFIAEIGRENIFRITTAGNYSLFVYTIFYEDGHPCRI